MQQTLELMRVLLAAEVQFIVVGGVAAIAHGSSQFTKDFDVVSPLTEDNCQKILSALGPYEPRFYQTVGRPKVDRTAAQLSQFKNLYFSTSLGIIDLLGSLPPVGDYRTVEARAVRQELFGYPCLIASLDDIIAVKEYVGRPKDKVVEVELKAIRERMKKP